MSSKYRLSVSLTEHLCGFVEAQIASGRFYTASEVIRAGLRLLERDVAGEMPARSCKAGAVAEDSAEGATPLRTTP
jgi:antitoxin ParD1/3/4